MRAVVDTNVVVSGVLSPDGAPPEIFARWRDEQFEFAVSAPLLREYRRALAYDRVRRVHRLNDDELDELVARLKRFATIVEPTTSLAVVLDDPDDNRVLECAVAAAAEVIVTGDKHLRSLGGFRGIRILSPADFLAYLDERDSSDGI